MNTLLGSVTSYCSSHHNDTESDWGFSSGIWYGGDALLKLWSTKTQCWSAHGQYCSMQPKILFTSNEDYLYQLYLINLTLLTLMFTLNLTWLYLQTQLEGTTPYAHGLLIAPAEGFTLRNLGKKIFKMKNVQTYFNFSFNLNSKKISC